MNLEGKRMKEDINSAVPKPQLNSNGITSDYIENLHKLRQDLLNAIQLCERDLVNESGTKLSRILGEDELNILKRVPDNKVVPIKISYYRIIHCTAM